MALYSQNGSVVIENGSPLLVTTTIPGTSVKLLGGMKLGDINTVFMYLGHRWNTEVEPLVQAQGNWGHAVRAVRGKSSGYSNHAAAEAADFNAAKHPLNTRTLTAAQLATLRRIQTDMRAVIRFGAFYTGRVDEMHAEKVGSDAALALLAADIRAGLLPNTPTELLNRIPGRPGTPAPAPTPAPVPVPAPTPADEDEMKSLFWTTPDDQGNRRVYESDGSRSYHVPTKATLELRLAVLKALAVTPLVVTDGRAATEFAESADQVINAKFAEDPYVYGAVDFTDETLPH